MLRCGTEKVPETRPLGLVEVPAPPPLERPSTVDRPLFKSITSRPPVSRFAPCVSATLPSIVINLALRS